MARTVEKLTRRAQPAQGSGHILHQKTSPGRLAKSFFLQSSMGQGKSCVQAVPGFSRMISTVQTERLAPPENRSAPLPWWKPTRSQPKMARSWFPFLACHGHVQTVLPIAPTHPNITRHLLLFAARHRWAYISSALECCEQMAEQQGGFLALLWRRPKFIENFVCGHALAALNPPHHSVPNRILPCVQFPSRHPHLSFRLLS